MKRKLPIIIFSLLIIVGVIIMFFPYIMNLFNKDNKSYLRANYKYNVVIQGIIYFVLGIIEISRYAII